ncbi:hypothetical protein Hanom_Chr04g00343161 [Helianthus anomalus]
MNQIPTTVSVLGYFSLQDIFSFNVFFLLSPKEPSSSCWSLNACRDLIVVFQVLALMLPFFSCIMFNGITLLQRLYTNTDLPIFLLVFVVVVLLSSPSRRRLFETVG